MKRVLLIQSRTRKPRIQEEQKDFARAAGPDAQLVPVSALDTKLDWNDPARMLEGMDAVLMGGSSDFFFHGGRDEADPERAVSFEILERVRPLIMHAAKEGMPLLGVCFGHQIIAEAYRGGVSHDHAQRKMGTYEVRLTDEGKRDVLFSQLPASFFGQYAHRDSVTTLPEGATLLAASPVCRFSALRYGDTVYTVQFHPELLADSLLGSPDAIAEYSPDGQFMVQESPETNSLIQTFLATVSGQKVA